MKPVIDKEKTLEERESFFDSCITEKESYEQNLKQKCSDLQKKLEEKHKSGLSSTDISIKKAAQDDIDESVEKYLDRNRMNTANLLHYLLQKGYREIFPNMMTLLELAAICPTTTAEVERGFSLMNLLCTLLRSSMLPKTLDYLTRICLAQVPMEDE